MPRARERRQQTDTGTSVASRTAPSFLREAASASPMAEDTAARHHSVPSLTYARVQTTEDLNVAELQAALEWPRARQHCAVLMEEAGNVLLRNATNMTLDKGSVWLMEEVETVRRTVAPRRPSATVCAVDTVDERAARLKDARSMIEARGSARPTAVATCAKCRDVRRRTRAAVSVLPMVEARSATLRGVRHLVLVEAAVSCMAAVDDAKLKAAAVGHLMVVGVNNTVAPASAARVVGATNTTKEVDTALPTVVASHVPSQTAPRNRSDLDDAVLMVVNPGAQWKGASVSARPVDYARLTVARSLVAFRSARAKIIVAATVFGTAVEGAARLRAASRRTAAEGSANDTVEVRSVPYRAATNGLSAAAYVHNTKFSPRPQLSPYDDHRQRLPSQLKRNSNSMHA